MSDKYIHKKSIICKLMRIKIIYKIVLRYTELVHSNFDISQDLEKLKMFQVMEYVS